MKEGREEGRKDVERRKKGRREGYLKEGKMEGNLKEGRKEGTNERTREDM